MIYFIIAWYLIGVVTCIFAWKQTDDPFLVIDLVMILGLSFLGPIFGIIWLLENLSTFPFKDKWNDFLNKRIF